MSFLIPQITDIIDILLIAFLLYHVVHFVKNTGGYQVLIGLGIFFMIYFASSFLGLKMISNFLGIFREYWVVVLIILFQQEIRGLFTKLAVNNRMKNFFKNTKKSSFSPLLNAISIMAFRKIGSLIVIENDRKLNDYIESGEVIDAQISYKLLLTIFNNKTILHDGAVVIRADRILACKVVLPLSENVEYTQKLGTRHLAAVGITENSDAIAIIVSEETGKISLASNGKLITDLTIDELAQRVKDETGK